QQRRLATLSSILESTEVSDDVVLGTMYRMSSDRVARRQANAGWLGRMAAGDNVLGAWAARGILAPAWIIGGVWSGVRTVWDFLLIIPIFTVVPVGFRLLAKRLPLAIMSTMGGRGVAGA